MRVFTVGHSTRSADEFSGLLEAHGVETAVDVRRFPASRRYPQFNRAALEPDLGARGIGYLHEPDMGGRRTAAPDSPNRAWRNAAFRGYADHMASPEFQAALARLIEAAQERTVAVFCAEAVPWRCHRRLIADALVARGIEVLHILSAARADTHELHEDARVLEGGRLVYGPAADQTELL